MENLIKNINESINNKNYVDGQKVGTYIFHNLTFNKGFEIFLNKEYDCKKEIKLTEKLKNVAKKSGVIYKERFYHFEELYGKGGNIIFILFNPSKACPAERDGTIKNCYNLVKNKYSTMEIINIYSTRNPIVDPAFFESFNNTKNISFIKNLLENRKGSNIVIAWGYGKETSNVFKKQIDKVKGIIAENELKQNYIAMKEDAKKQLTPEKAKMQNNHAADIFWGPYGGFANYAYLTERKIYTSQKSF